MAAFSPMALFALLAFFYAYLLLHVEAPSSAAARKENAKHDPKCPYCDIIVEKGKIHSMIEHLESHKEDEKLQQIEIDFLQLVKEVDDKFNENIFKNFPRLALQTKNLCDKFCKLNGYISNQASEEIVKKEGEVKLRGLDKKLAELHQESIPICDDAAMRACEVRERIFYLKNNLQDNVPAQTFLEDILPLATEFLNWTTTMAEHVNGFITTRKMKKNNDELDHYDQEYVRFMKLQLHRVKERIINLQQSLVENLPKLQKKNTDSHNPLLI